MKNIIFILLALLLAGCAAGAVDAGYVDIGPDELNAMLENKDFLFVNVHIPFEGDIPGTDLSIPFDEITDPFYLSQLPTDKSTKIVLYCRSGRMSDIAANELVALGYTNILNLDGGMIEWEGQGFEIIGK